MLKHFLYLILLPILLPNSATAALIEGYAFTRTELNFTSYTGSVTGNHLGNIDIFDSQVFSVLNADSTVTPSAEQSFFPITFGDTVTQTLEVSSGVNILPGFTGGVLDGFNQLYFQNASDTPGTLVFDLLAELEVSATSGGIDGARGTGYAGIELGFSRQDPNTGGFGDFTVLLDEEIFADSLNQPVPVALQALFSESFTIDVDAFQAIAISARSVAISSAVSSVPVPPALWLFGSALIFVVGLKSR